MKKTSRKNRAHFVFGGLFVVALMLWTGIGSLTFSQSRSPGQGNVKRYVATEKIVLDKKTKELRMPTDQELKQLVANLERLTDRSGEGLETAPGPGGSQMVHLQHGFQHVVISRPNADGTMQIRCVNSMEDAAAFLGLKVE